MKALLCGLVLSSFVSYALADLPAIQPDPRYAHRLSSSGPLSRDELLRSKTEMGPQLNGIIEGAATYTYLRCYYRTGGPTRPTTDYVWAADPSSGDYYRLNGYWAVGGTLAWQNMFYSDVAQTALQSICQNTLAQRGIEQPVSMVFAADNQLSFNYTVWTNDAANQDQRARLDKIIVFGDSLSDNQNIYNASLWTLPNRDSWHIGHFSNDYVWDEYLAQHLALPLYVWAVGGAGVDVRHLMIPGVVQQVQSWKAYMQRAMNYDAAKTLFVILIGANDIEGGMSANEVISTQTRALTNLIEAGARNVLLVNLPDISKAPIFQYRKDAKAVSDVVRSYNTQLDTLAAQMATRYGSALNIKVFDTYAMFDDALAHPAAYQLKNTSQPCLDLNTGSSSIYLVAHDTREGCSQPSEYLFWDIQHPSAHTHRILADAIFKYLRASSSSFAPLLNN